MPDPRIVPHLRELARQRPLSFRVSGDCMAPLARHGDRVEVAPARVYWPGDVVAVRRGDGTILLHRLLGWRPRGGRLALVTQADRAPAPDPPAALAAVVGRVRGGGRSPALASVPLRHRRRAVGRYLRAVLTALARRLRVAG